MRGGGVVQERDGGERMNGKINGFVVILQNLNSTIYPSILLSILFHKIFKMEHETSILDKAIANADRINMK